MNKTPEHNPLDANYENMTQKLSTCIKVIEMMETPGWKEIIGPRINNMINEYSGTITKKGLRSKGIVANSPDEMTKGELCGMIDVYNMIVSHDVNYEVYKKRLADMETRAKEGPKDYMGAYE